MKFDNVRLDIKFKYIEKDNYKKTIAYATIFCCFPGIIMGWAANMADDEFPNGIISSCAVCKNGDTYDRSIGERIARKKLIRKYFRFLQRVADNAISYHYSEIEELLKIKTYACNMQDSITKYIKKF